MRSRRLDLNRATRARQGIDTTRALISCDQIKVFECDGLSDVPHKSAVECETEACM